MALDGSFADKIEAVVLEELHSGVNGRYLRTLGFGREAEGIKRMGQHLAKAPRRGVEGRWSVNDKNR